ncbi:MAG: NAD-dependent DNA ligase LigA [Bacteroidia bacterium]|nr:NAD-dependent DNA ligase LigA [Bacteroidia bacterium]MCX7651275.1 NAD-dependent DNA ligase LigA [Bacteroidia bacterium]MDW8416223.1 NAD-dependent DNA ligase LigA [Bacteroidia bacterium]
MNLTPEAAAKRISELIAEISEHDYRYYVLAQPTLSDSEYDRLVQELRSLEERFPELRRADSPTQRVGGTVTKEFPVVAHRRPMLSLDNAYTIEELRDFEKRLTRLLPDASLSYIAQLKIDGVAVSLHYKDGIFIQGLTRGDGLQGDDITPNLRTVRDIPLRLRGKAPSYLEVRGEVYMLRSEFNRINKEREELGETPFMNPRNATAGSLKLQDSSQVAQRRLKFLAYFADGEGLPDYDHEIMALLAQWGFHVVETGGPFSMNEVEGFIERWAKSKATLPYDIDGVVIKVNNRALQARFGATAKAPRWAIAFKYQPEQAITELQKITYQVGRTGYITPVAELKPVKLAGTIVKRASLYNYDEIERLNLHLPDVVVVEKSGEIIPKVIRTLPERRPSTAQPADPPQTCPECGTPLIRPEGEVGRYCPNYKHCPPQVIGRLEHFVSRKAMNIQSLGEKILRKLYEKGLVKRFSDLYALKPEILTNIEGFAEKMPHKIVQNIQASKSVPYPRVLYALGIRHVGETVAQKLAEAFPTIGSLYEASEEAIAKVYTIGSVIARSVYTYLHDKENWEEIQRLRSIGLQFSALSAARPSAGLPLSGKRLLVSGTFEGVSRDSLIAYIQAHGGIYASSISKNLDYLVVGENAGPSKLEKARRLGIKVLSLPELEGLVGKPVRE